MSFFSFVYECVSLLSACRPRFRVKVLFVYWILTYTQHKQTFEIKPLGAKMQPGRIHPDSIQLNMPIHSRNVILGLIFINNALTNVQKRSSVYFHFRYIPFDCTGKQAIILNNLLLDFFVLFSCEWFMKRIAFFCFCILGHPFSKWYLESSCVLKI